MVSLADSRSALVYMLLAAFGQHETSSLTYCCLRLRMPAVILDFDRVRKSASRKNWRLEDAGIGHIGIELLHVVVYLILMFCEQSVRSTHVPRLGRMT
jgi:hypothetical protein